MASRYWVQNGGNWSDALNHWSDSSGGAPNASLPTASDNVFFDSNSFSSASQTVTVDSTSGKCLSMDWTGATNTPTLAGSNYGILIYGSVTFISAMVITLAQPFYMSGTGNITTNGLTITAAVSIYTGATSYTLQDNLTISNSLLAAVGTFDSNNKNISVTNFTSNGSTARTLTLGSSVITCSGNITFTSTNLTMTANTSKFVMTGADKIFSAPSVTFNNLELQNSTYITESSTFNDLKLTAGKTYTIYSGRTITVTTLSGDGASGSLITLKGQDDVWQYTISCASGEITKFYCSIKNCTASGGATFIAVESTDGGSNTGWVFYGATAVYPTITYPTVETVVVNAAVTFTWTTLASRQTHYDLDYSLNGIVWTNFANKVASATSECEMTAGTFSSHIYYWRVRVYFIAGTLTSGYSQTSFIAVINPVTTDVDCDHMPQPTITWTASEQQAFQIKVGTYETGTIYSATGSYHILNYFDDDTYGIHVRTQNNLGVWSAWTVIAYFAISNTPDDAITLTASQTTNAITLVWTTTGTYAKYFVYRDDVPIADVTDVVYVDNFSHGSAVYKVRGILANEYYTMSNSVTQALALTTDMVSLASTISWITLKYALNSPIRRNYNNSDDVSYLRFAGREYPVSAHTGFKNRKANFSYAFLTLAEVTALQALSGETVIYKDVKGNRIIGILNDIPYGIDSSIHEVAFSITQTDYNEEVDYT